MPTLITGARGQLGRSLSARLPHNAVPLGRDELDVADAAAVRTQIESAQPEVVINCAAYNLVDKAEEEPEAAHRVNALGPRNLALACAEFGAILVHVSTDYVFGLDDARRAPYSEDDAPGPVSAYGTSKLAGEYFVRSLCPSHFVVRTCGLFGPVESSGRGNFVETMLRVGGERGTVSVVDDQICSPTSTDDLADAILALLETHAYGLYHATNQGETTWKGFAEEILQQAGMEVEVQATTTADWGAAAGRPSYSVLDCGKLHNTTGLPMPDRTDALARYLNAR